MTCFKDPFCSVPLQTGVCFEFPRSPHRLSDFGPCWSNFYPKHSCLDDVIYSCCQQGQKHAAPSLPKSRDEQAYFHNDSKRGKQDILAGRIPSELQEDDVLTKADQHVIPLIPVWVEKLVLKRATTRGHCSYVGHNDRGKRNRFTESLKWWSGRALIYKDLKEAPCPAVHVCPVRRTKDASLFEEGGLTSKRQQGSRGGEEEIRWRDDGVADRTALPGMSAWGVRGNTGAELLELPTPSPLSPTRRLRASAAAHGGGAAPPSGSALTQHDRSHADGLVIPLFSTWLQDYGFH